LNNCHADRGKKEKVRKGIADVKGVETSVTGRKNPTSDERKRRKLGGGRPIETQIQREGDCLSRKGGRGGGLQRGGGVFDGQRIRFNPAKLHTKKKGNRGGPPPGAGEVKELLLWKGTFTSEGVGD